MAAPSPTVFRRLGWRLEALAYDLFAGLAHMLPVDSASALGGLILRLVGPLTGEHRVAHVNLALAFPEMDEAERRRVIMAHWDNLGRTAMEFVLTDRISVASGRIVVEGGEHVMALAEAGRPAILVSGHFANWEAMAAAATAAKVPLVISYRRANNPYVDERIVKARSGGGVHLFAAKGSDGSRALISELNRGGMLGFLNDQRDDRGIEAPFFGGLVRTAPGPSRMALSNNAALIPIGVERLRGARFKVTAYPAIDPPRTGNREADVRAMVTAINAFIEARVRERPEQWLWSHKRWPRETYARR